MRWRCRRGTRELDIMLARILECRLEALDDTGLDLFERLLRAQDPELHAWLTGVELPGEPQLDAFVLDLREAVGRKKGDP